MTPGPNGIKPNSGLKSLKSNCGKDKLCSCIFSASAMDTIKSRIVRLTFAQAHCSCPHQEVLSPSHRLAKCSPYQRTLLGLQK